MNLLRICVIGLILVVLNAAGLGAQHTEIVPGSQQNLANIPGVGARAMGMAGAHIAEFGFENIVDQLLFRAVNNQLHAALKERILNLLHFTFQGQQSLTAGFFRQADYVAN